MSQPLGEERRVVPFTVPAGRMRRRIVENTDGRGAILLFTGIRYERSVHGAALAASQEVAHPPRDPRLGN